MATLKVPNRCLLAVYGIALVPVRLVSTAPAEREQRRRLANFSLFVRRLVIKHSKEPKETRKSDTKTYQNLQVLTCLDMISCAIEGPRLQFLKKGMCAASAYKEIQRLQTQTRKELQQICQTPHLCQSGFYHKSGDPQLSWLQLV